MDLLGAQSIALYLDKLQPHLRPTFVTMRIVSLLTILFAVSFFPLCTLAKSPVRSLGYVLQADGLANSQSAAVKKLAQSDRDLIVIDASYDGTSRWSKRDVGAIRAGKPGRKVICYLSVGEAEDYRSYWNASWDADKDGSPDANAPKFLAAENPDWEGNYKVKYWDQQWQDIILAEVQRIIAQGFDGVYLDIIDGFEFYEYDARLDDWIDNRPNPETGNTYREDMVGWVSRIRKSMVADGTPRWVIPQNGEALTDLPGYLELIDAIAAEDVFTNGKRPRKKNDIQYRVNFLKKAAQANKPVYVIEYPQKQAGRTFAIDAAKDVDFSLLLTDRPLKTLGESGNP